MNPPDAEYGIYAETQAEVARIELRIAPQPLDDALQEFSRQSGIQIIFFSRLTDGIESPGVTGNHTLAAAMERLLDGSGLSFRMINARTVEVFKVETP